MAALEISELDLRSRTLSEVEKGLLDGQCACLPELVRTIHNLSGKVRNLAIQELADIIKNDTVVLQKVISAAGTVAYNPTGKEINSASDAIQVIGFDRVRSLCMSLMLMEEVNGWQFTRERRQATLTALAAGLLAEHIASETGEVDSELAFLCGALRGYGKIVLSTYLLDSYMEARKLSVAMGEDRAFIKVFGITAVELGRNVLKSTHMNRHLLQSLNPFQASDYRLRPVPEAKRLLAVADFAYTMARTSFDHQVMPDDYGEVLCLLVEKYQAAFDRELPRLDTLLIGTQQKVKALMGTIGPSPVTRSAINYIEARLEGRPLPKILDLELIPGPPQSPASDFTSTEEATRHWEGELAAFEQAARGRERLQGAIMERFLRGLRKGLPCDECWIFLQEKTTGSFQFRHGLGAHSLVLQGRARVRPAEKSLFGIALSRRESIFIENVRDPKVSAYLPDWFRQNVQLNAFLLLALHKENVPVGLLLAGWKEKHPVQLSAKHSRLFHQLLQSVGRLC